MGTEDRSRPEGIDDQIVGLRPFPASQKADTAVAVPLDPVNARADRQSHGLTYGTPVENLEQSCPVDDHSEATGTEMRVAHIEHHTLRWASAAVKPIDTAAEGHDLGLQPEPVLHHQPGRLQDQTGPERTRRLELVESPNLVAGLREQERRSESRRPAPGDRDVERTPGHSPLLEQFSPDRELPRVWIRLNAVGTRTRIE